MCSHPSSYIPDAEVEGLGDQIAQRIGESLQYCCQFWGYHLIRSTEVTRMMDPAITTALNQFMDEKSFYWVEAMSLMRVANRSKGATQNPLIQCADILNSIEKVF